MSQPSKIYKGVYSRQGLQELCIERGLPIKDKNGNTLTIAQLKALLDEFEQPKSGAAPATPVTLQAAPDLFDTSERQQPAAAVVSETSVPQRVKVDKPEAATALPEAPTADLSATTALGTETTEEITLPQTGLLDFITGNALEPDELAPEPVATAAPAALPVGPYYLQLSHGKLGTCLSRAVFLPVALDPEPELHQKQDPDLLTRYPDFLPLVLGQPANFSEDDVLVELTLRPEEISRLIAHDTILALAEPLPVSRIRRLLFANAEAHSEAEADAKTYKNYFLPQQRVAYLDTLLTPPPLVVLPAETAAPALPTAPGLSGWTTKLAQFDRQLGLFSYLKHASLLQANVRQAVQDYPAELSFALSLLNAATTFTEPANGTSTVFNTLLQLNVAPKSAGQSLLIDLVAAIYNGADITFEWALRLLDDLVKQVQTIEKSSPDWRYLVATRDQLDQLSQNKTNYQDALSAIAIAGGGTNSFPRAPYAALVLLCKFPNRARSHSDKQSVLGALGGAVNRKFLPDTTPLLEWLLAILGLYYGYARLTREDPNLRIDDPKLAALAQPLHRLRFNTDIFADRAIIETVFRFAAEGHPINDSLTYLRPAAANATTLDLPLRATSVRLAAQLDTTSEVHLSKEPAGAPPTTSPELVIPAAPERAVQETALLEILRIFDLTHFQQVLLPSFTPAVQTLLRQLLASR